MMSLGSFSCCTISKAVCGNRGLSDRRKHLCPLCVFVNMCVSVNVTDKGETDTVLEQGALK